MDQEQRWLVVREPVVSAGLTLVCFPYGGGGAGLFRNWPRGLPPGTRLAAAQLPGREERIGEPLIDDCATLVRALAGAIGPLAERVPYVLFGHSLGAMLAFEVARIFQRRGLPRPRHLVVSGCRGPQAEIEVEPIHALPDAEFIDELRRLRATPEELLDNSELMELVLPRLRADFAAADNYRYRPGPRLACPITAFSGADETDFDTNALRKWALETRAGFDFKHFSGGHFFIHSAETEVLASLSELIERTSPHSACPRAVRRA